MAKINDGVLRDFKDGDKMTSDAYEQDREIIRVAINDNDTRVKNLEKATDSSSTGLAGRMNQAEVDIDNLEDTADTHNSRIRSLEDKEPVQDQRLDDLETTKDNHESRVSSLEGNDSSQDGKIGDLETSVYGSLAPSTFNGLSQMDMTFDQMRIGYVDSRVDPLESQLAEKVTVTGSYGTKATRPTSNLYPGREFFLTDLLKRIEYNGFMWQYLDGTPIDTFTITDGNIYSTSATYTQQTLAGNAENTYQNSIDMTKDLILYTRLKLSDADDYLNINFGISSTLQFQLSFGYNWSTSAKDGSSISIHDSINAANTVFGSMDLYSTSHDVVVWYDHKWGYLNVYVDNVLKGSWKPSAGANLAGVTRVYAKAGSTSTLVTLDYWYMGMPLVTAIGDSITAGAIKHAPNPDYYAGVDDYSNNYPKMISDHLKSKGLKNYFVVNKGVNGETTDQVKARFSTDVVSKGCKYVFIHSGINDHSTHHDVNISTQNKIDMANTAVSNGILPIILGVLPTKTSAPDITWQFAQDLNAKEKASYNAFTYINLWRTIENPSLLGTADDAKLDDTVHPNLLGYTAITNEIKKYIA